MKKIGLMGLAFHSANKGCCALAYSFLKILNMIAENKNEQFELYIFQYGRKKSMALPKISYDNLKYHFVPIIERPFFDKLVNFGISKCDIIFDFTAGDSFTDIYGMSRFSKRTALKEKVIAKKVPLVLGSQTYGPFNCDKAKSRAAQVLKTAAEVFSRDRISSQLVQSLSGRIPIETTDIAFFLPYNSSLSIPSGNKKKIGINPSGLLWNGGYSKNNQFALTVDYQQYLRTLIKKLTEDGKWEIHLIPHVIQQDLSVIDNDLAACTQLKKEFPNIIVAPSYELPMDVKSYIAQMDVFTGARMHATIGAFSAGVPVIPFSYSRKFEGLFATYSYDYIVSATKISTEDAINKTLKYIENYEELKNKIDKSQPTIKRLNEFLLKETEKIIYK